MWIALPFARSLTGRFVRAAGATALAGAALVTVAALVEGHPPRASALRAVVGPLAGILGACWVLGAWRRTRGDVAAAALGWRPGWVGLGVLLLALPLLALGPAPGARRGPSMTVSPTIVEARLPDGPVRWRWTDTAVVREASGEVVTLPLLPRPRPPPAPPDGRWLGAALLGAALRAAALAMALVALSLGRAPGPSRVVVAATTAFAVGHGAAWWVG